MPWDLAMNPITGDFVSDGHGGWKRVEDASTAVLHQLRCHHDRWWADSGLGARFFDRAIFAAAPGPEVQAESLRAMGVLVSEDLIADLEITANEARAGRVNVRAAYRVVASGQLVDAVLPILPGGP